MRDEIEDIFELEYLHWGQLARKNIDELKKLKETLREKKASMKEQANAVFKAKKEVIGEMGTRRF